MDWKIFLIFSVSNFPVSNFCSFWLSKEKWKCSSLDQFLKTAKRIVKKISNNLKIPSLLNKINCQLKTIIFVRLNYYRYFHKQIFQPFPSAYHNINVGLIPRFQHDIFSSNSKKVRRCNQKRSQPNDTVTYNWSCCSKLPVNM